MQLELSCAQCGDKSLISDGNVEVRRILPSPDCKNYLFDVTCPICGNVVSGLKSEYEHKILIGGITDEFQGRRTCSRVRMLGLQDKNRCTSVR